MVNMAKIAWAFDLSPGAEAVDVGIETAYTDGFLIAPKKFPISFTPRSSRHRDVIEEEFEAIQPFFERYVD